MTGGPTVQRSRLGRELRRLRQAAGLDQAEAAEVIESDQTTVSRIERGQRKLKQLELKALLERYGVDDAAIRERLTALARASAERGSWLERFTSVMGRRYRDYARYEADATRIDVWDPVLVPGLLQTEEYARAVIRGGWREIPDDDLELRVEARMRRQEEMTKRNPRIWAVLDRSVLDRTVGGADVMREQLRHLLTVARNRLATIQIMPLSQGAHLAGGHVTILGFDDEGEEPPRVYTETLAGDLYLQGDEAAQCTLAFDHLRANALDADASVREIHRALSALE